MPRKPRKVVARGKHSIQIEGAVVFNGHITIFKSDKKLGRYIVVADSGAAEDVEVAEKK